MKKKVVVALSGGVDSAVTAYLLKKEGYEVICVFMQNWDNYLNDNYSSEVCTQNRDWKDACEVATQLQIPIFKITFIKEYWNEVFSVFLRKLEEGLTPNPDILCNKIIKFNYFLEYVKKHFQPDLIATGHYAKVVLNKKKYYLEKAKDEKKDQTYFLCQISRGILDKIIFPLADYKKKEVREIARDIGLKNAVKKDSVGICFVGQQGNNFVNFLKNYLPEKKGDIQNFISGKKVGEHQGVHFFTIGQRRKLFLFNQQEANFVVGKDIINNILFVVTDFNNPQLYSSWCLVTDFNWMIPLEELSGIEKSQKNSAKFRHQQVEVKVKFKILDSNNNQVLIKFIKKQRAITPGQAAVLYHGNICLGGGIILNTERNKSSGEPITS